MFRLQCIKLRSQTFLAKTKSPNTASSPPLKSRFRLLIRKQNKRRRFRLLCLSRFPVMAVATQHGYHYGHGFNYPVTSTSISEDFTSIRPIKRNEVLPLKKRKASMLSKHDFVAERCPEMLISRGEEGVGKGMAALRPTKTVLAVQLAPQFPDEGGAPCLSRRSFTAVS